jgi:hypothetical protein
VVVLCVQARTSPVALEQIEIWDKLVLQGFELVVECCFVFMRNICINYYKFMVLVLFDAVFFIYQVN